MMAEVLYVVTINQLSQSMCLLNKSYITDN